MVLENRVTEPIYLTIKPLTVEQAVYTSRYLEAMSHFTTIRNYSINLEDKVQALDDIREHREVQGGG